MDIKDILLLVDADEISEAAIAIACRLALRDDAFVHGRCVVAFRPSPAECFAVGAAADRTVLDRAERGARAAVAKVRTALGGTLGMPGNSYDCWQIDDDEARIVIPSIAQTCDLVVMGHELPRRAEGKEFAEGILMRSGTPLLLVPNEVRRTEDFATVVLAWNGTAESKRAMDASFSLLSDATQVLIVVVDDPVDLDENNDEHVIAERLAARGMACTTHRLSGRRSHAAHTLIEFCEENGADLLVMGAFGHPRRWEAFVGGTSHVALAHASLPLLMAN